MERLTRRSNNGTAIYNTPSGNPVKWKNNRHEVLRKLAEYEDLEEQGLLLKLPCKVGDMFFCIWMNKGQNPIQKMQVKKIEIHERKGMVFQMEFVSNRGRLFRFYADDFGKTVFLARAEAEEALREIRAVQARNGGF